MADNESTEVLKEVVKNEEPSDEEHHVDEADHKYSDHEGLIKKLFNYNRFIAFFTEFYDIESSIDSLHDRICTVPSTLRCNFHPVY